jgi:hypothetical protein
MVLPTIAPTVGKVLMVIVKVVVATVEPSAT